MTGPGPDNQRDDTRATSGRSPATARPILVVDDDALALTFAARALRAAGYDVLTASTGREALRTVYSQAPTPAVLLTDLDLPGMSGIELAARLTAERPNVATVLMTGDPSFAETAADRRELVQRILLKPFEVDELLDAVTSVLGEEGVSERTKRTPHG